MIYIVNYVYFYHMGDIPKVENFAVFVFRIIESQFGQLCQIMVKLLFYNVIASKNIFLR